MNKPFLELLLELEEAEGDADKSDDVLRQIAARVDDIKTHVDDLEAKAIGLLAEASALQTSRIDPLIEEAQFRRNEAERVLARVQSHMVDRGYDRLPGNLWRLDLRENQPKVIPIQEPNAEIYLDLGDQIVDRKVIYAWKKKAVASEIKAGRDFPYAKLEYGKRVEFGVKK